MRSKQKTLLAVALLGLAAAANAADVITLNWRDGDEVAAALRPQLRDGEKLGALGNQLILDAPPGRSAELRRLIRQLDVKSSSLLVEVAQDGVSRESKSAVQLGGQVQGGGYSISTGKPMTVRPGSQVVIAGGASQSNTRLQASQALRMLDGKTGFIEIGSSRPLPWLMFGPDGRPVVGVRYQDAVTGFYARPRLHGQRVTLELAASQQAFNGQNLDSAKLATTVEGAMGEWLTVGGIGRDQGGQETVLIGVSRSNVQLERSIKVRVTPAQ